MNDNDKRSRSLREIERLLLSIDRPGDYCSFGKIFTPMPVLEVEGVGTLSFPVAEDRAKALFSKATLSPFGKGTKTLVDENVRNSREISPEKISLGGGGWKKTFAEIVDSVAEGLGCPRDGIDSRLYKLLVYGPGGFFLPHRDLEKEQGMVATLVVALPVAGGSSGGEIVVRHGDRETSIDMRPVEPSEIAWAAFYADCEHEVLPVAGGHRLVLVFNLIQRNGSAALEAPDFEDEAEKIARELNRWKLEAEGKDKIVWLLDHNYSEKGLSFESLKNRDAAVARVLVKAAEKSGCSLYAAVVKIEEYGVAIYEDEDFTSMGEIFDSYCDLEGFSAPDGARPKFGSVSFRKEEVMPLGEFDHLLPDEEGIEEWTGNAGATYERTYRQTALSIWPKENSLAVLASEGISAVVAYVEMLVERGDDEAREIASRLPRLYAERNSRNGKSAEALARALRVLLILGDESTLEELLTDAVVPFYHGTQNPDILDSLSVLGPDFGRRFLSELLSANLSGRTEAVADIVSRLLRKFGDEADWGKVLVGTCGEICDVLDEALAAREESAVKRHDSSATLSPESIADMLSSFLALGMEKEAECAAEILLDHPESVTPDRVIPRAMAGLVKFGEARTYELLWKKAAEFLLERSAEPPSPPADWTRGSPTGCDCQDCADLRRFCENPDAREYRFRIRQDRRDHLTYVISRNSLDIDSRTEETGRPYALVCVKNYATHKRRLKQYEEDVDEMKNLAETAPPSAEETGENLLAAVRRGTIQAN